MQVVVGMSATSMKLYINHKEFEYQTGTHMHLFGHWQITASVK